MDIYYREHQVIYGFQVNYELNNFEFQLKFKLRWFKSLKV